jgi:phospholipid-binding lipoprotein MlaA
MYYIINFQMSKLLKLLLLVLMLSTSAFAGSDGENELTKKNKPIKDCFESLNRATFALNQGLDKIIFRPVAKAYRVLPSPVRAGTSNALDNLSSVVTIPNNLLQGEFKKAGINTGRFVVNTTFGVIGIIDVADMIGFPEYEKEDYGQTLGTLGFGPGCYLVLPVIGPSTVRDTIGSLANVVGGDLWYNVTVANNTQHFSDFDYWSTRVTTGIDFRAKNIESFENLEKNSMDFYASVRSLYLQDRQMKISNSNAITETMDDSDWEEIETR